MCPSKEFFLDGVPGALGVLPLCLPGVRDLDPEQSIQPYSMNFFFQIQQWK